MSSTTPLVQTVSVILSGAGAGTARVGPKGHGTSWAVDTASVSCSTNTLEAQCLLYVGPDTTRRYYRDGTLSGSTGDSTDHVSGAIRMNAYVIAVWTGGDAGAQATLTVAGTETVG